MMYEKKALKSQLRLLKNKIDQYTLRPEGSESYLVWMQLLHKSIANYISQVDKHIKCINDEHSKALSPHIEVIKKQALIIEAAGIQYPTINQSMGHIQDIYLSSKGRLHEIGGGDSITFQIPII